MGLLLVLLVVTLTAAVLGVAVAAVRNGVSAPESAMPDELAARLAQQRRHSSRLPDRQRMTH
jgi:hypothetical protein